MERPVTTPSMRISLAAQDFVALDERFLFLGGGALSAASSSSFTYSAEEGEVKIQQYT